ncbi:MAG: GNAT family N-acetyltransferase [Nocardioidaceae bacterium]
MSDLRIARVVGADREELGAWHAVFEAATRHGLEYASPPAEQEIRAHLLGDDPGQAVEAYGGYLDGRIVATGLFGMPLMDNLDRAGVGVCTHPDQRNRGYGTAMLEFLLCRVRESGRALVNADATTPYDAPPSGAGHPNADFLLHHGFSFALGNVMRVLDLPADGALLDRLGDDAARHHAGAYTLRQWRDRVPDDVLVEFGDLVGSLMTEAPTGDLVLEQMVFDEQRIRADEEIMRAAGRTKYCTVAVAPDGTLAAYSEIGVPSHDPGRLYQWGTLVRPAHRGHRLGVATKVANLRTVQSEVTDRTLLVTFNAEVNEAMIAVNEAMGFRPVQRLGDYELTLERG